MKVDSTTQAISTSSWYEIWEGINSIAYMCVRQTRLGGQASKLGKQQACKAYTIEARNLILINAGSLKTMTLEMSLQETGVDLSSATLLNASSGPEDLLLLSAGAQNFSSVEAS